MPRHKARQHRAARALDTLGCGAATPGLDNVLELGCPGPTGLARTQAENEISLRRKKELD